MVTRLLTLAAVLILVIGAVLTLIGNLIADISYALADPRIRNARVARSR